MALDRESPLLCYEIEVDAYGFVDRSSPLVAGQECGACVLGRGGHECIVDGPTGDLRFEGNLDQGCLLATRQCQWGLRKVRCKQLCDEPRSEAVGWWKSGEHGVDLERDMGRQSRLTREGRAGGHVGLVP